MEKKNNTSPEESPAVVVNALLCEVMVAKYTGFGNYKLPKIDYLKKVASMDEDHLETETYSMIYQSARCSNNPRADWHWMVDVCYDECKRRDGNIYVSAYNKCYRDHVG